MTTDRIARVVARRLREEIRELDKLEHVSMSTNDYEAYLRRLDDRLNRLADVLDGRSAAKKGAKK